MTERPEDRYEVPVGRLVGGRTSGRRARVVAGLAVLSVGVAVALAVLSSGHPTIPRPASPPAVAVDATPRPVASSADVRLGGPARTEALLALPDRSVAGAPRPTLIQRRGSDAVVATWTPGSGLTVGATFAGAFADVAGGAIRPQLSPDGNRLLVLSSSAAGQAGRDRATLFDRDGTVLWAPPSIAPSASAVWSAGGGLLTIGGADRRWQVLAVGASGAVSATSVSLPAELIQPVRPPAGAGSPLALDTVATPVGYSADGHWIYGAVVTNRLGTVSGQFRVAVPGAGAQGGRVEVVSTFGVGRADGLLPQAGTFGGRLVDPIHGLLASWQPSVDFSSGPFLEVRRPAGTLAFVVNAGTPLGSAWDEQGDLYVLASDGIMAPDRTSLVRIGPRGEIEATLLASGAVAGAALIGVRDGYAALTIAVSRPAVDAQIVLVDLADPRRISAVDLGEAVDAGLLSASLVGGNPTTASGTRAP